MEHAGVHGGPDHVPKMDRHTLPVRRDASDAQGQGLARRGARRDAHHPAPTSILWVRTFRVQVWTKAHGAATSRQEPDFWGRRGIVWGDTQHEDEKPISVGRPLGACARRWHAGERTTGRASTTAASLRLAAQLGESLLRHTMGIRITS